MRKTAAFTLASCALTMCAWNAPGHRMVTERALDMLPPDAPAWLRDPDIRAQIMYQANLPDRWRGVKLDALAHENAPDHFIDLELLVKSNLTLETLPRLRYDFVAALARAQGDTAPAATAPATTTPAATQPPRRGVAATKEEVGYLPWAIMEHHDKLLAEFNTLRILEQLNDPARANQVAATRATIIYEMGQLSHFVGDAGQPLHTTIHHHGWVGENPDGFTADRGFHSYIDGDVVALHQITVPVLAGVGKPLPAVTAATVWDDSIALIKRSHQAMRPLYVLQKSGELQQAKGAEFIAERMADAASVLAGLYYQAWKDSTPTPAQVKDWVKYDASAPLPPSAPPPASADLRPTLTSMGLTPRPQGSRGTCSIFTTCWALEFALAKRSGSPARMSPEYLNWAGTQATGRPSDGNFFHNALAGWEKFGLCSENAMPYAAAYDAARKPTDAATAEAATVRADSTGNIAVHWIVPWAPNHFGVDDAQFAEIKRVLASGYPVAAGSGHSRLLVGYHDDPSKPGGGAFITEDSALNRWDEVPYEFVRKQVADVFWVEARPN